MRFLPLFLSLCLLLGAGCAGQSAAHLPLSQWKSAGLQTVQMRYLSFQYQVVRSGNETEILATAYPVIQRLPDWASWYGQIELSVYITDDKGIVLMEKKVALLPRPLQREGGLPVEVAFDLGLRSGDPLFITFGYNLVLTDTKPEKAKQKAFAAEGALAQ